MVVRKGISLNLLVTEFKCSAMHVGILSSRSCYDPLDDREERSGEKKKSYSDDELNRQVKT